MKVAVVGAHGVVGSATVPLLLANGFYVRLIDPRLRGTTQPCQERIEFVTGDILDESQMLAAVDGCDIVIHVATAIPEPGPSMEWSKNDAIRRQGTLNLLAACAPGRAGVRALAYARGNAASRLARARRATSYAAVS